MPDLVPVDHDPFPGMSFVPVDHDPFTDPMSGANVSQLAGGGEGIGRAAYNIASLPQRAFEASENRRLGGDYDPAPVVEAASLALGVGAPFAEENALGVAGGRLRDPALWHGISAVKLPKPISEMRATIQGAPATEKIIRPADLQGGALLPAIGDRSAAGGSLQSWNGYTLPDPVELQGGHGYMAANTDRGVIWASNKGVISGLENKASNLAESGQPVYFPYTAMGERSVDFSHHVSDALAQAIPQAKISEDGRAAFDAAMRNEGDFPAADDWPGIDSSKLREYLLDASGNVRNKFAKLMDTAKFQNAGFPSVAEARFAVTDPRLLNVKTGESGLSISQLTPGASRAPTQHLTYEESLPGKYVGGFGTSVPKEVMYPDITSSLESYRQRLPGYKPTVDYLMTRTPRGQPIAQQANQQWVDTVSNFLRQRGLLSIPASGVALGDYFLQPIDHDPFAQVQ